MSTNEQFVEYASMIARENKVDFDKVLTVLCEALAVTIRRKYDGERLFKVAIDPETSKLEIYRIYKVVETVHYPTRELSIEAALLEDPNLTVGSEVCDLDENEEIVLDRISFSTVRQIMANRVKDLRRDRILSLYEPYLGQVVFGTVKRISKNCIHVTLPETPLTSMGQTGKEQWNDTNSIEAYILKDGIIASEIDKKNHNELSNRKGVLRVNEEIAAVFTEIKVDKERNSKKMILSRTHPNYLGYILAKEIPEIKTGDVEVVKIVREAGTRAKVSVRTNDPKLDVLGACIGPRSERINAVNSQLSNERVDIIQYSDNFETYIQNALAQQDIKQIQIDEVKDVINVVVDKENLSPTIGKFGSNVKLAAKLIDMKIKVYCEEDFADLQQKEGEDSIQVFVELGLDEDSAKYLVENGFTTVSELANCEIEDLEEIVDNEQALLLQKLAQEAEQKHIKEQIEFIENSNVEERLKQLEDMTPEILVSLINEGVLTLEDLADKANDELSHIMSKKIANSLIREARNLTYFSDENEEA